MTPKPKPVRTLQDVLREMRERVAALPTPKPRNDAPPPPRPHHEPEETP